MEQVIFPKVKKKNVFIKVGLDICFFAETKCF